MTIAEMFQEDAIDKQLNIAVGSSTYTNHDIQTENMELTERLCSGKVLRFGCCEASTLKLRFINRDVSIKDMKMAMSMELQGEEIEQYPFGQYKVSSDKPTANRKYRDIVAYDVMHDIITADVAEWYNTILPAADSTVTLKQFRDSFLAHFGIEQEEVVLVNDDMVVTRTVAPVQLSGKAVITAICEINGCFGHIGRDGRFMYVFLPELKVASYPEESLTFIKAEYEDFTTERITKIQIRQEEDDIGCTYGTGDNCYVVQDNFLLYGKSTEELTIIAGKMFSVIKDVWYRPAHVEAKGNPCLEVGDAIRVSTEYAEIYTYILQRTLKGIQALRDTYDAEGEQYQKQKVNSVRDEIIQLKGKANTLKRTIEETQSTITNMEKGMQSQIAQNAGSITSEVKRATEAEGELSNRIEQAADSFAVEINNIQNQIDGNISTYNLDYVPTLYNYPAWDWTYNIPCNNTVQLSDDLEFEYTDEYYRKHARSVAVDTTTFITYRFLKKENSNIWNWMEVADSDYSYVLQQISQLRLTDEEIELSVKELEEEIISEYITAKSVESIIAQTAQDIRLEVSEAYETKDNASSNYTSLNSKIELTSEQILSSVSATYETKSNSGSNYTKLESKITQTADSITAEVTRATSAEGNLSTRITQNANSITAEVKRAQGVEGDLSSKITQTADSITAEVTRATSAEGNLSTKITQTADSIETEVKRAKDAEGSLSSRITQNANSINLKVSKGSIISEINQTAEAVTISASKIDLNGLVNADEFVSKYATINSLDAMDAKVEGKLTTSKLYSEISKLTEVYIARLACSSVLCTLNSVAQILSPMVITVDGKNIVVLGGYYHG